MEELIAYNQLLDHLEQAEAQDNSNDQELYRFRAIIGHKPMLDLIPVVPGFFCNEIVSVLM